MKLSPHFTLEELCFSRTAVRCSINNFPDASDTFTILNLSRLCSLVLEPLRSFIGKPLIISSCYRCSRLNVAVGGVYNSNHLKGLSADIPYYNFPNLTSATQFLKSLRNKGILSELIFEKTWVHVTLNINY